MQVCVSLFTREWIEIRAAYVVRALRESPSLRGSGLKSSGRRNILQGLDVSLFTREWIEITAPFLYCNYIMSPSLRGSGLKCFAVHFAAIWARSPSLRGSGLKWGGWSLMLPPIYVSLFTREWIEIEWRLRNSD